MNTLSDERGLMKPVASAAQATSVFGFRIFQSRIPCVSFLCALALLLTAAPGHAALYSFSWNSGFANAGVVPDGNVTGWSDTRVLSGITDNTILDVNVTLQLTGGWNGDLYGYLTHSSGFSVLLNRVGRTGSNTFGCSDAGMNVSLDDSAANGDIHLYQTVPGFATSIANGSAWAPDGRNVNPLTALNTDPRTSMLNSFNGLDPNGSWTLFLADVSSGEQSTVANWVLNIQAEPRTTASVPEAGATLPLLGMAMAVLLWFARRSAAQA